MFREGDWMAGGTSSESQKYFGIIDRHAPPKPEEKPSASQAAEPSEPVEQSPVDAEDPRLDVESKQRITDQALDLMRGVLRDQQYTIFASTAMYLHGQQSHIKELLVPPGDLDMAVFSLPALERLRERFANVPGVKFKNEGKFITLANGEAKVLAGEIMMSAETNLGAVTIAYPFEVFFKSVMVNDEVGRHQTTIKGLTVLDLEGLQRQYLNNLSFEMKVRKAIDEVVDFLKDSDIEAQLRGLAVRAKAGIGIGEGQQEEMDLLNRLRLTVDDVARFYEIQDTLKKPDLDDEKKNKLLKEVDTLLANSKTKIPKRLKNVKETRSLRAVEVS